MTICGLLAAMHPQVRTAVPIRGRESSRSPPSTALEDALCGLFSLFTDNDNEVVTICGLLSAMHPQVRTAVPVRGRESARSPPSTAMEDALCGLFSLFTDNDDKVVTICGLLSAMHPQLFHGV